MPDAAMSHRPLAIITTRLPPAICGVGAHSALLRRHWPVHSTPVEFLVIDGAADASVVGEGDRVTEFHGDAAKLSRALERLGAAEIVFHYAGRAYQRWGCPVWLPGALAQWRRKFPEGRLLIFIHEMPGDFAFTSRHFWLGKVNAWILRRLASIADIVVTNTEPHRRKLMQISGRDDIHLLPVGSNIEDVKGERPPRVRTEFALFGLPFGRWQTLLLFEPHLRRWLAHGQLTKLHIIGPQGDEFADKADGLIASWGGGASAVRHGAVPEAEVARLLQSAQFALTNATPETWSKSTVFMTCALHGCAPIIAATTTAIPLSYAVAAKEVDTISESELQRRAEALRVWYAKNADWSVIAVRLAALLAEVKR